MTLLFPAQDDVIFALRMTRVANQDATTLRNGRFKTKSKAKSRWKEKSSAGTLLFA
jgi:hypothetical protein